MKLSPRRAETLALIALVLHLLFSVLMFLLSGAAYCTGLFIPHHFLFFYILSWGLLALIVYLVYCTSAEPVAAAAQLTVAVIPGQLFSSLKPMCQCVPSQNGLFFEPPQRHSV